MKKMYKNCDIIITAVIILSFFLSEKLTFPCELVNNYTYIHRGNRFRYFYNQGIFARFLERNSKHQ